MRPFGLFLLPVLALVGCTSDEVEDVDDVVKQLEPLSPSELTDRSPEQRGGRILIFTRTKGFRHDSIPVGVRCLRELAAEQGLEVDQTEDPARFNPTELARFRCVVFLSTTGDILEPPQEKAFEEWMESGGAFFGIHAATDTEFGWPWYGKMVGAYFSNHPKVQPATQDVVDATHPSTAHLPARWRRTDEWYNFRSFEPDLHVLLRLDETSYTGGNNRNHPSAWCKAVGKGRMFYTAGGHTKESFAEPEFRTHLAGALRWLLDPNAKITPSKVDR